MDRSYPVSGTSPDAFGNERLGDVLIWTVDVGSLDGTTWTPGTVAETANTVDVMVAGSDPEATGTCTAYPGPMTPTSSSP